jgi:hypothetical protein
LDITLALWIIMMEEKATSFIQTESGKVAHSFLFIRSYPVSPGSQIVVPERPEVKKLSTGEVVSIGSGEFGFINRYCF